MAENEILDLGSRRWRPTRAALANTDLSLAAIAQCIVDNLQSEVQLPLSKAREEDLSLLTVLQAVDQSSAAGRSAIESFPDQQLARIVRDAAKFQETNDPVSVAWCATDLLIDSVMSRVLAIAARNGRFRDDGRREELMRSLQSELDARRGEMAAVIEASLRGHPVRQWRRKRVAAGQTLVDASDLANRSLSIHLKGANHVQHQP